MFISMKTYSKYFFSHLKRNNSDLFSSTVDIEIFQTKAKKKKPSDVTDIA